MEWTELLLPLVTLFLFVVLLLWPDKDCPEVKKYKERLKKGEKDEKMPH